MEILRLFTESFNGVSRKFKGYFMEVSGKRKVLLHVVIRVVKKVFKEKLR